MTTTATPTKTVTAENVAPGDTIHEKVLTIVDGQTISTLAPLKVTHVDDKMLLGKFKGDRKERLILQPVFDA